MDAAKGTFKSIAVAEPRVRAAAKAGLMEALKQRFSLIKEAALARASSGVDAALLTAAQQISTVSTGLPGRQMNSCVACNRGPQQCQLFS